MRLFSKLYDRALSWAKHRYAPRYLVTLSFAESSFFPVPPDVMLAPMVLATPSLAWRFAAMTTIASVAGGVLGYFIGYFAFDLIKPWLQASHYWQDFLVVKQWADRWGFWAIFIAGFSPIPYKLFTISAGAVSMAFFPFVVASLIGRGARFFLVSGLIRWGGQKMALMIRQYIDIIGWAIVVLLLIIFIFYY